MQFLDIKGVQQFKTYNDSKYITTEDVSGIETASRDVYTKTEIDAMLQNVTVDESDPVFTASAAAGITSTDITNWNSQSNAGLAASVSYDSSAKRIYFYDKSNNQLSTSVDTTDFIKDGMVNTVAISTPSVGTHAGKSCLVITFNTDAGKSDIEIPLEDIFNPSNYYDKTASDARYLQSYTETDPVFSNSTAASITAADVTAWNGKQDEISDLAAIRTGAGLGATALQSYTETDPTVPAWAKASSKPTYTASEVGALPSTTVIPDAPGTLTTTSSTALSTATNEALSGNISLHKVAKTGTYSDLIGTPSIPTESTVSGWGFTKNTGTLTGVTFNGNNATVTNGVAAITVTIPTVNDNTITIQKGGTTVDSFTLNASANKTINIPNELPSYSASDSGKILSVNSSGQLVWITPASIYSGSAAPSSATGNNGDIYLQS